MVGDDVRTALSIGQAVWGALVFVFTLGGLAMWVRLKIGGLEKRTDKLEDAVGKRASTDDLKVFKEDIIREMYALHGVERRTKPR